MTEKLQLRCSALPLAFRCAGSVRRGDLVIDERNAAGDMGTAAHDGHAAMVNTGRVDWDGVGELAGKHGVEEPELRSLLALGAKLWDELRESFPNASTEIALTHEEEEFVLTGHVDVLGISAGTAHVGDWKDGRLDKDFAEQLMGYCALVLTTYADLERATSGIMWVREQEFEHYSMGRHLLKTWFERLRTEVVRWDGTFRPGDHCVHCHRNHECPARRAVVRRDVEAIAGMDIDDAALAALTAQQRIDLVIKARAVAQIAERVVGAIKADVVKNGDVEAGGMRLTVQRTERRRLNVLQAFPILQEKLEDSEMAEVIEISIAKAEQAVRSKAVRGKGAGAVRALNQALVEAGAIEIGVTTALVVRRAT